MANIGDLFNGQPKLKKDFKVDWREDARKEWKVDFGYIPPLPDPIVSFPLRGVNYLSYGDLEAQGAQLPRSEATTYYRGKGMNVFRFAVDWEVMQPTLGGPLTSAEDRINKIQNQINTITATGANIIIEVHNYMRRTENSVEYIVGETPTVTSAHLADFWTKLANQFKDNTRIIWGLMNEPHDQNDAILLSVTNAAIAAIRSTGSKHLIMVCGNGWNSYGWQTGQNNLTNMLGVVDSANNYCFDVHHYFDSFSAGQTNEVVAEATWKAGLTSVTNWARTNSKKLFCGEFAYPATTAGMAAGKVFHDFLVTNNDVWIGWAQLAGGGWWPYNYVFRLDPFGSQWDNTNPFAHTGVGGTGEATTWTPIVDQLQMTLLEKYLPNTKAVNLIPNSRKMSADAGIGVGTTITNNVINGVYGTAANGQGMAAVIETNVNDQHYSQRTTVTGLTAGQNHVISVIVKEGNSTNAPDYRLWAFAGDYSNYSVGVFHKSNFAHQYGFGGNGGTFVTGGTVQLGGGVKLIWIEFIPTSTSCVFRMTAGDSAYTGVNGQVLYYVDGWFLQRRTGAIPTTQLRVTDYD